MQNLKVCLYLLCGLTMACNTPTTSSNSSSAAIEEDKMNVSAPESATEMVGNIPVYRSYADLEHIFTQKTDSTYVINFWATWCRPCVEELPYFEKLHESFADEKLKVVLVSLDFPNKFETKLLPFVEEHKLRSDVVAFADPDQNAWIPKIDEDWGGAIPITVIYNAESRKFIGEQFANYEELDGLVRSML